MLPSAPVCKTRPNVSCIRGLAPMHIRCSKNTYVYILSESLDACTYLCTTQFVKNVGCMSRKSVHLILLIALVRKYV